MADKDLEINTEDLNKDDELDLDLDIDLDIESLDNDREPETPTDKAKEFVAGVAEGVVEDKVGFVSKVVEKVLPDNIRSDIDGIDTAFSDVRDLYTKSLKEIRHNIRPIVNKIDKMVPSNSIFSKALATLKEEDESSYNGSEETDESKAKNYVSSALNIDAKDILDRAVELKQFNTTLEAQSKIYEVSAKLLAFNTDYAGRYYRKSLELQYRQLLVNTELLNVIKKYGADSIVIGDKIVRNTGLPDFVKLSNTERMKEVIRNQTINSINQSLFGGTRWVERTINNVLGKIRSGISAAAESTGMISMVSDQAAMASDMDIPGMNKYKMAGSVVGADSLAGILGTLIKNKVLENDSVRSKYNKATWMYEDLPGYLEYLKEKGELDIGENDNLLSMGYKKILNKLQTAIDTGGEFRDREVSGLKPLSGESAAIFDNLTKRSITSVIPKLLSKIYTEVHAIRTGREENLVYDYNKDKLVDHKEAAQTALHELKSVIYNKGVVRSTTLMTDTIAPDLEYKDKKVLSKLIIDRVLDGKGFTIEHMLDDNFYKDIDNSTKERIKNAIRKEMEKNPDLGNEVVSSFLDIRSKIPDLTPIIENLADRGYREVLENNGVLTTKDDGSVILKSDSVENLLKELSDEAIDNNRDKYNNTLKKENVDLIPDMTEEKDGDKKPSILTTVSDKVSEIKKNINTKDIKDTIVSKTNINVNKAKEFISSVKENHTTDVYKQLTQHIPKKEDIIKKLYKEKDTTIDKVKEVENDIHRDIEENKNYINDIKNKLTQNIDNVKNITFSMLGSVKDKATPILNLNTDKPVKIEETNTGVKITPTKDNDVVNNVQDRSNDNQETTESETHNTKETSTPLVDNLLYQNLDNIISKLDIISVNTKDANARLDTIIDKLQTMKITVVSNSSGSESTIDTVNETPESKDGIVNNVKGRTSKLYEKLKNTNTYKIGETIVGAGKELIGTPVKMVYKAADNVMGVFKQTSKLATTMMTSMLSPIKSLSGGLTNILGNLLGGYVGGVNKAMSFIGSISKGLGSKAFRILFPKNDVPMDLYRPGIDTPVIKAELMRNGFYINSKTKRPIRKLSDMTADILDRNGNVVLTIDEINAGLYDKNGNKVKIPKITYSKVLRVGSKLVKSVINTGLGATGKLASSMKSTLYNTGNVFSRALGSVLPFKYNIGVGDPELLKHISNTIDNIHTLLEERLPKPKNRRKYGWRNRLDKLKKKDDTKDTYKKTSPKNNVLKSALSSTKNKILSMLGMGSGDKEDNSGFGITEALGGAAALAYAKKKVGDVLDKVKGKLPWSTDKVVPKSTPTTVPDNVKPSTTGKVATTIKPSTTGKASTTSKVGGSGLRVGGRALLKKIPSIGSLMELAYGVKGYITNKALESGEVMSPDIYNTVPEINTDVVKKKVGDVLDKVKGKLPWSTDKVVPKSTPTTVPDNVKPSVKPSTTSKVATTIKPSTTGKVASSGLKAGGKTLGKSLLKKIPVIGLLVGLGYGIKRYLEGDTTGAGMEIASGIASTVPGVGTATSVGIDAALAARDMNKTTDDDNPKPVLDKVNPPVPINKPSVKPEESTTSSMWGKVKSLLGMDTPTDEAGGDTDIVLGELDKSTGSMDEIREYAIVGKGVDFSGMNPELKKNLLGMAKEYYEKTGQKIHINSAYRSMAEQRRLYAIKGPGYAAKPGRSLHNYGLAVDINTRDVRALNSLGLIRKYGFTQPLPHETWHLEPIGIEDNITRAKKDKQWATQRIAKSRGHGTLGWGQIGVGRDRNIGYYAVQLMKEGIVDPVDENIKLTKADIADKTTQKTTQYGTVTSTQSNMDLFIDDVTDDGKKSDTGKLADTGKATPIDRIKRKTTKPDPKPINKSTPITSGLRKVALGVGGGMMMTSVAASPTPPVEEIPTIAEAVQTYNRPAVLDTPITRVFSPTDNVTTETMPVMTETLISIDSTLKQSLQVQTMMLNELKKINNNIDINKSNTQDNNIPTVSSNNIQKTQTPQPVFKPPVSLKI